MNEKIEKFAEAMSDLLFDMRADDLSANFLRTPNTDTLVPLDFINKVVDEQQHIVKMKTLIKNDIISHLTQCPSVFTDDKGEYHYTPDVYDFSYVMDTYVEQLYEDQNETKTILVCPNCKSDNVQVMMWVNANTNEVIDSAADEGTEDWCDDCRTHVKLDLVTLKPRAKVIGFQVVGEEHSDEEGNIHPDMDASFCIYNLQQAKEMLTNDNWRLLTIWEGDVEEPTMMFEGNVR